jgi:hypothetical protein
VEGFQDWIFQNRDFKSQKIKGWAALFVFGSIGNHFFR